MCAPNRTIKIIKRENRDGGEEESNKAGSSLKTENEIRREILNTITSWIEHQRKAKKASLRSLRISMSSALNASQDLE